ncbi:MAG: phosphoribosylformylglycinamidine synthase subunit PurS [Acidimicrobiia bacterium]|nr:phosphoribosylformylglycinamidine synthase subunit PurS [Acidimicrobiia bacterium]
MRVVVSITRKDGLSDPEGATTAKALRQLGYPVGEVHFGRTITLEVDAADAAAARAAATDMCTRLLANPVIEDFTVFVSEGEAVR